ncbi:hypothetical protein [Flavobacterium sandaracinum]|uniref:hypothetical protein n=1 Tax=Flavobacterium sandaracinum TaxID=2541733 RepID=UPI001051D11F|nr:hypothetical protein [Flavobacterium sandaracinum]
MQKIHYQVAGSSQVRPTQILNTLDESLKMAKGTQFSFSTSYKTVGETDDAKIAKAFQKKIQNWRLLLQVCRTVMNLKVLIETTWT